MAARARSNPSRRSAERGVVAGGRCPGIVERQRGSVPIAEEMRAFELDDAPQPAAEASRVVECRQASPGGEKGLLGEILGEMEIADAAVGVAEGHRLIASNQLGESVGVAGFGVLYELVVIHGCHLLCERRISTHKVPTRDESLYSVPDVVEGGDQRGSVL